MKTLQLIAASALLFSLSAQADETPAPANSTDASAEKSYISTVEIPKSKIAKFDKDGDAKLNSEELKAFEAMIISKKYDKDNDGKINETEYKAWLEHSNAMADEAKKAKKKS